MGIVKGAVEDRLGVGGIGRTVVFKINFRESIRGDARTNKLARRFAGIGKSASLGRIGRWTCLLKVALSLERQLIPARV
jgi:hypothetical protein